MLPDRIRSSSGYHSMDGFCLRQRNFGSNNAGKPVLFVPHGTHLGCAVPFLDGVDWHVKRSVSFPGQYNIDPVIVKKVTSQWNKG
jgi:hypothetical protein